MSIELTYTKTEDYYIPDLTLTDQDHRPLGRYSRLRKQYLREHRPILWNHMILSETLFPHLREIEETAKRRLEQMLPDLMKAAEVTEDLKARGPMTWVGLMNTCKAQAEEIIFAKLIYN